MYDHEDATEGIAPAPSSRSQARTVSPTPSPGTPSHEHSRADRGPAIPKLPPLRDASGKKSAYWDETHPDHAAAVRAVQEQLEKGYPEESEQGTQRPTTSTSEEQYELESPHVPASDPAAGFFGEYTSDFAAAAHEIGLPRDLAQECLDAVAHQRPLPELPQFEGYEGEGERVLRAE